jgi:hypothetical protein
MRRTPRGPAVVLSSFVEPCLRGMEWLGRRSGVLGETRTRCLLRMLDAGTRALAGTRDPGGCVSAAVGGARAAAAAEQAAGGVSGVNVEASAEAGILGAVVVGECRVLVPDH